MNLIPANRRLFRGILSIAALALSLGPVTRAVLAQNLVERGKGGQRPPGKALEQPPREGRPNSPTDFTVIPLKQAAAPEVARVLQEVFGARDDMRIVVDERTNSLLVAGNADQLASLKRLLPNLDVSAPPLSRGDRQFRIFVLKNAKPDGHLEEALRMILKDSKNRFAVDRDRNQVIAFADPNTLDTVEALLVRLDQAPPQPKTAAEMEVRVVWLASGLPEDAPGPPPDLGPVVQELERIGMSKPRLVSQTLVKAVAGAPFQAEGTAVMDVSCNLSITGTLLARTGESPGLQISIQATTPEVDTKSGARRNTPVCRLNSQITAPFGHAVVLGMTPTNGKSSAFVLQVMPADRAAAPKPGAKGGTPAPGKKP